MQFLATLKIKIDIPGFLGLLSKKMRSNFIFRVAICFYQSKQLTYGTPENKNLLKIL